MKKDKEDASPFEDLQGLMEQFIAGQIDNKSVLGEKTDDLFFRLIKATPNNFTEPFVLEKINKWQRDLEGADKDMVFRAQCNLKKIGTTLALRKRTYAKCFDVALMKNRIYKKLKEAKVLELKYEPSRRLKLKKLFGDKIIDSIAVVHPCYGELADEITAKLSGFTKKTVERYCKKGDRYTKLLKKFYL